jgi:AbrB family looped-hinge helix DNA binding protein
MKLWAAPGDRYIYKGGSAFLKWDFKMEIKIGNKGRITIPRKLRLLLGIKEGDSLVVEVSGSGILLKPKGASVGDTWGLVHVGRVEVEEVEEAAGRESP